MASTLKRRVKVDTFKYYDLIIYAARNSSSARALARALGCRRWFEEPPERYQRRRAFFRGRAYPTIVNWGSTVNPTWGTVASVVAASKGAGAWMNPQEAVDCAINKLETLKCLTEAKVPCLRWTTDKEQVQKWLKKEHLVLARKVLGGASGAGIVAFGATAGIPDAPLYTRNFPKTHEFRVHVFDGQVIDFVEKKARLDQNAGTPSVRDRVVRNHNNGWIFAHDNLSVAAAAKRTIEETSVAAVRSLGLLFGAVDILAILSEGKPRELTNHVVCEVNTAPGLECTQTIAAYVDAINRKHVALRTN